MIPKIIHYCWLSNDPYPEDIKKYMKSWKEKLPDYEFVKWDLNRFDIISSVWVKEAFEAKKYAFACDYIRLYAVYNYGGIYMDMDVEVLKSFDDLLEEGYFFGYERPNQPRIEAGIFGAEKGNAFLGLCLEQYKDKHFVKEDGSYDERPIPYLMTDVIKDNDLNLKIHDWQTFTANSFKTLRSCATKDTYTIHHFAGSWKEEDERLLNQDMRRLAKIFSFDVARNLAEIKAACRVGGGSALFNLFKDKLVRKLKK